MTAEEEVLFGGVSKPGFLFVLLFFLFVPMVLQNIIPVFLCQSPSLDCDTPQARHAHKKYQQVSKEVSYPPDK